MKLFKAIKLRLLIWVWQHTPNCVEMSRLASQSLDRPLGFKLRVRMRLHHLICVWCQRYQRQLEFIRQAAARSQHEAGTPSGRSLSPEARRRIVERLRADFPDSSSHDGL